jgi:hypothetical protein
MSAPANTARTTGSRGQKAHCINYFYNSWVRDLIVDFKYKIICNRQPNRATSYLFYISIYSAVATRE